MLKGVLVARAVAMKHSHFGDGMVVPVPEGRGSCRTLCHAKSRQSEGPIRMTVVV